MPSADTTTTTLATDLQRLGFNHTADQLNDLIAEATRKRWSATVLLERVVGDELEDKHRRSVESRLKRARLGRFKPLADWDPPGRPRRTLRPVHHRRRPAARPQRTGDRPRPRTTPPALHAACAPGLRRGRLPRLRCTRRRPDLPARQPPLRAPLTADHHQSTLQTLGHRLPQRLVRRRSDRPLDPPCRDPASRRPQLSQTRGRAQSAGAKPPAPAPS